MISPQLAKQLQIDIQIPIKIQNPSFKSTRNLWIKQDNHHQIQQNQITNKRYIYSKSGKIFAFQRTRYITFYQDHFFYYEEENDKKFKGYCCFQNVYFGFYPLKNKKFLFYLSNGNQQSIFYFETDQFYKTVKKSLEKLAILLNFSQTYHIQNTLGKGSFSQVYLVKDTQQKKLYAAKVIPKYDKNKAPTKNLVQQQRRILQQIKSQFVYEFKQFYQENDSYVFILEYLTGKDLMTLFKQETQFSLKQLIFIFRSILQGLSDFHKSKIFHRDLKPQNIIINLNDFKPKIIDFGLSLMLQPYTQLKCFKRCGTMGYMAPQVIANTTQIRKPYTQKCDIFSLGIIAYMILLGKNPLKGKTYEQTYSKNKLCQIQLDREEIQEKYGNECYVFLSKMLEKNAKLRDSADQALKSSFLMKNYQKNQTIHHHKQQSAETASQQLKCNKVKSELSNQIVEIET